LILACSQRKSGGRSPAPAIHLYDGVNYRVLRKFLRERGWPPGLQIKILSAKYGLIDATDLIEHYDQRLDQQTAGRLNKATLKLLKRVPAPASVFVNLGADYLLAVRGIELAFPQADLTFAPGPIGKKMRAMKKWLHQLPHGTASVGQSLADRPSYLYFFPDWDDYIYTPFRTETKDYVKGRRTYAYEICAGDVPFDGILLSLSHIHVGKGALHRFPGDGDDPVNLRAKLRVPDRLLLFGDCGAFSYAGESTPPFSPEKAAKLYDSFGFDIAASVDHIPLREVTTQTDEGHKEKRRLSESARYARMYLTRDYAERFLEVWKREQYRFVPLGVIQGIGVRSYLERIREYVEMGYEHVALGGLVPRTDDDILRIVCAARAELQKLTVDRERNLWLHLFGILRPKLQPIFKSLGVSSFDSASYFRKAWLRSDQNYLAPDGSQWYGTIRVPISTSKRMRTAAETEGLTEDELATMERECLEAIDLCDKRPSAKDRVIGGINRYGPLLDRKGEDNHFAGKHEALLRDRPWEKCVCPFCQSAGIHVVVFRGASRNKRRGLHNTWVFYHKVLHGDGVSSSVAKSS
jgi:hypothetical protein